MIEQVGFDCSVARSDKENKNLDIGADFVHKTHTVVGGGAEEVR